MRRMGLIKRGLAAALCCMLCVPVIGGLPQPIIAKADTPRASDSDADLKEVRENACKELDEYYKFKESFIPEGKRAEARAAVDAQIKAIKNCNSSAIISERLLAGRATVDSYIPSDAPDSDPEPTTTNSNIMVGGNWITPVANGGQYVNVVLPIVNMGRRRVKNAVVTPQISQDPAKWPFEIETSNYTQTIDRLPGTDEGGDDMERRRELTWVLKTRKDAPGGYMPIAFDVTYENDDLSLTTVTLTTYVNVKGTTGVSSDGTASTPRVIVTGFSTSPEEVRAGETFTLTLHMQNTSRATAVQNMLFDIQAASESTDTTYVAAAFLPTAGSSTIFVDRIAAGATKDISMEMEARSDLAQKPYVVNVKMNYEDENVNAYENTASVSIPVRQEARVDISSIEVMPDSIDVGNEANVMFSVYNIGKTKLFNTSVKFISDSVSGGDTYLGNIEPGATANVDAYLSGAAATMDDGIVKIEITFEDEAGEATTIEKEMTLFVNEMYFPNDMEIDGVYGEEMIDSPGGFKIWWAIVPGILIVIGIIVFVVIRRKKKKAQELLELEEDLDDAGEEDLSDDDETETEKLSPWKKWKKRRAEKRNGL
ncbi:MAG: hypothetical protein HFI26_01485 [Lachnospiraceae bacterium]|jgi:hypothetical protein|nr:hypothetical protein [Lachnospiraceae bacterium]